VPTWSPPSSPPSRPARRRWLRGAALAATAPAAFGAAPSKGGGPVALALGMGSAHGIVHVGVLRAAERRGFRPDLVTGTSAGAIAGALWAAGVPAERIGELLPRIGWWRSASMPRGVRGLLGLDGLQRLVADEVRGVPIERFPTRFAAVATELATGARVVLDRGDAARAVTASACVPALYVPVRVDGRDLVDGGLVEPVPVRAARDLGARRVIAVDVQFRPWEEPVGHPVAAAFQSMQILIASLTEAQIAAADLPIRLDVHHLMEQPGWVGRMMTVGEQAFEQAWPTIAGWIR
jgi:NTE family protein